METALTVAQQSAVEQLIDKRIETKLRAEEVFQEVTALRQNLLANLLSVGERLAEAKHENHAEALGFGSFSEYIEAAGLDFGERQAHYLIKIVDNARALGISSEELQKSKISKLKEIFTLDPQKFGAEIKQLVADSSTLPLDSVREAVARYRGDTEEERLTWRNFRVSEAQAAVVDQAVETAKRELGDIVDHDTGEVIEPSDGRALEVICADFNGRPDPVLADIEAIPTEEKSDSN